MRYLWSLSALVVMCTVARADSFTLDFESFAPGVYDGNVGLTYFDPTTGIEVTLTRSGSRFEIAPTSPEMTGFGAQTLSPFVEVGSISEFVFQITSGPTHVVGGITFDVGDFNGSDVDLYSVTTFRNQTFDTNTSNGILDGAAPFGFTSETQSVQLRDGISFMVFTGGSDPFFSSLFWDNFVFETYTFAEASALIDLPMGDFTGGGGDFVAGTSGQFPAQGGDPVPEPATLISLGACIAAFALFRRQRRTA